MTRTLCLVFVILSLSSPADAQKRPRSLEREARDLVGKTATLCGRVVAYQCLPPERTSLLALDEPFSSAGVSLVIASADRVKFGLMFEPGVALRNVCATGIVEKQRNRYTIALTDAAQIQAQGEPTSRIDFTPETVSACDDDVELPTVVREVKPAYTRQALRAGTQGTVLLEAVVLANGEVGNMRVLRSLDQGGLDKSAMAALSQWRFAPGKRQGQTVPMVVTVELSFGIVP